MKLEADEAKLKKIRGALMRYALRRKLRFEEAEDFAQEALMEIIRRPKAQVPFLFVDYLRRLFGRTDSENNIASIEFRDVLLMENELHDANKEKPDTIYKLGYYTKTLTWYEQKLLHRLLHGETMQEMGKAERRCIPVLDADIERIKRKIQRLALGYVKHECL